MKPAETGATEGARSKSDFICGVVEGFYGRPWNARQRHQLFDWMESWGLSTYLYAPKDDLKHRLFWRERYDEIQGAEMATLIGDCQRHDLNFIYALAPGLDPNYAGANGEEALHRKAGQLLELGCRHFALLFDDIATITASGAVDFGATPATEQADFANRFLKFAREKSTDGRLLFCPTIYCGRMAAPVKDSAYLRELGRRLDPAIQVLWTGPEIVSETITPESIKELAEVIQRKPIIWDNLHANDYDLRRLYMGPYSGRPLELRAEVAGILSNPNCEFEVNFVPLRTLAMYAHATDKYEPRATYLAALKEWLPSWEIEVARTPAEDVAPAEMVSSAMPDGLMPFREPVLCGHLEILCDYFYLPFEHGRRADNLLADFRFLLRTPRDSWRDREEMILIQCVTLEVLATKLTALRNRDLLYAIYRHVWELKEELRLATNYLAWLRNKPGLGETFTSPEYRTKTYRGGFVADLQ
ncbi:MAG: hypothetical protein DME26_13625, partial [Verrucomicrobia bacterium]